MLYKVPCIVNNAGILLVIDLRESGIIKLFAAEELQVETDEPGNCRWCAMERPIVTDIGHGGDFQHHHPNYPGGYVELLG